MKMNAKSMIPLALGAVALYFILKPRTAKAATLTTQPAQSAIRIGSVSIPSAPVANLISTGVGASVNALTSLFTGGGSAPAPAAIVPYPDSGVPTLLADPASSAASYGGFRSFGRFAAIAAISR